MRSQVPMSRLEPDEHINDRYKAIEERLTVRSRAAVRCLARPPGDLVPELVFRPLWHPQCPGSCVFSSVLLVDCRLCASG